MLHVCDFCVTNINVRIVVQLLLFFYLSIRFECTTIVVLFHNVCIYNVAIQRLAHSLLKNLYSASILAHCSETNTMSCSLEDSVFVSNLAGIQFVILVDESCLNSLRWPKQCLSVNRRTMCVEL